MGKVCAPLGSLRRTNPTAQGGGEAAKTTPSTINLAIPDEKTPAEFDAGVALEQELRPRF